jgi:diguanylate cyclase (GGDEF)-like protein
MSRPSSVTPPLVPSQSVPSNNNLVWWRSLRLRLLVVAIVVWLLLIGGLWIALRVLVQPAFVALENQYAIQAMARVRNTLTHDLESLEHTARSFSNLDEMYGFALGLDPEFPTDQFTDSTLRTLNVSFVCVYDRYQQSLFFKVVEPTSPALRRFIDAPPVQFKRHLASIASPQDNAFDKSKNTDTLRLDNDAFLELAFSPILTSDGHGPFGGIIAIGRLLDSRYIESLRVRSGLPFVLRGHKPHILLSDNSLPRLANGNVSVSSLWNDASGHAVATIELTLPALIVERGRRTLFLITFSAFVLLSVVYLLSIGILELHVVIPLSRLTDTIQTITATGKLDTRLGIDRHDELGVLSRSFEHLLGLLRERAETLVHMATIDELTDVYNRRAIMDFLTQETDSAARYHHPLSILLLDVDYFKRINDTDGHAVGDRILKLLAQILKNTVRETDRVGRYGGEEFLVVLPHQDRSSAQAVGERLRSAIETYPDFKASFAVTISIGVATWDNHTKEALLYVADKNLYRAKSKGRNRVVAQEVPSSELPKGSVANIRFRSDPASFRTTR